MNPRKASVWYLEPMDEGNLQSIVITIKGAANTTKLMFSLSETEPLGESGQIVAWD